jgi:hypothetical protein
MRQTLPARTLTEARPRESSRQMHASLLPPPALRHWQEHRKPSGKAPVAHPLQPPRRRHTLRTRPPLRALRPDNPGRRGRRAERHPPVRGGDRWQHGRRQDPPWPGARAPTRKPWHAGCPEAKPRRGLLPLEVRSHSGQYVHRLGNRRLPLGGVFLPIFTGMLRRVVFRSSHRVPTAGIMHTRSKRQARGTPYI